MMMRATAAAMLAFAIPAAWAADMPAKTVDTAIGPVLADGKGMTLYIFDKDEAGKSNCAGECARNWPPLLAGGDAKAIGDWSVVDRGDGTKQWAYKGKPLYLWVNDSKPGDTSGDGVRGIWHAAKP